MTNDASTHDVDGRIAVTGLGYVGLPPAVPRIADTVNASRGRAVRSRQILRLGAGWSS